MPVVTLLTSVQLDLVKLLFEVVLSWRVQLLIDVELIRLLLAFVQLPMEVALIRLLLAVVQLLIDVELIGLRLAFVQFDEEFVE